MNNHLSRRSVLLAPALLSLVDGPREAQAQSGEVPASASKTLVAYYSRSGNTRVIAGTLKRDVNADLFEIRTVTPYPEDYEQTVEQARKERDAGIEPPLLERVREIRDYETVYLGFPI